MKKILNLVFIFLLLFIISACSSIETNQEGNTADLEPQSSESAPTRIIIYHVDMRIKTDNLNDMITTVKSLLNDDEWLDNESIQSEYAYLIIRVKSSRLDSFVHLLTEGNEVNHYNKKATDISLDYRDIEAKILTLQLQINKLNELYETSDDINALILINEQLANKQTQLDLAQGQLNRFDSLVDYSTIELSIHLSPNAQTHAGFFSRIGTAFVDGFNGLLVFLDFLVIVIVTILPSLVIIIPFGFGARYLYLRKKNKRNKVNHKSSK